MCKLDLEKAEEPEIKLPNMHWIIKKATKFQKNIYFCFIDYAKAFDCVDHNKPWKILLKRLESQTTLPASWEICMQVKKQQLEWDVEQRAGSKLQKHEGWNQKKLCPVDNTEYLHHIGLSDV